MGVWGILCGVYYLLLISGLILYAYFVSIGVLAQNSIDTGIVIFNLLCFVPIILLMARVMSPKREISFL